MRQAHGPAPVQTPGIGAQNETKDNETCGGCAYMIWNSLWLRFIGNLLSQKGRGEDFHIISASPGARRFSWYCGVDSYSRKAQKRGYSIEKVIVIHRHGDRAPVTMKESKWEEKTCVSCVRGDRGSIGPCGERKCESGDLTVKGYEQLKKLGRFVKEQYGTLLGDTDGSLSEIDMRATAAPRTYSSLFGLVNGIKRTEHLEYVNIPADDSLLVPESCRRLNEVMKAQGRERYKSINTSKRAFDPMKTADNYWTHMCNDVAINCNVLDCSEKTIWEYLDASSSIWKEQAKVVNENESILRILFGKFAGELAEIIVSDTRVHIYSVHDGSLSSVLAGLGARVYERPPYGSAIFIERWTDKKNDKFVRVVYNNRVCRTLIDGDTNIPLDKFLRKSILGEPAWPPVGPLQMLWRQFPLASVVVKDFIHRERERTPEKINGRYQDTCVTHSS
ncbi:UNVERIFIED_CONTAM: hypothetical protein PYX00_011624 [Menopon gallinae]|uniref:2-phosphoxylose phosphatase 1 n=1 Tax=Menopon gallinae TaxID=328185 RepID=A0AAW2H7Y2_9NEOP